MAMTVLVQTEDFDLSTEVAKLRAQNPSIGAVVSFVGVVRDLNEGLDVQEMELEHYPGMTEKALQAIVEEASRRWSLMDCLVIHRVGALKPLDQIVLVAVATSHRGEAFAACEFMMDYLKTQAPFWKKEQTPQGARWVDAREADDLAVGKWGIVSANSGANEGGKP
jgi:molybdopterin synthase catalytic subunit